MRFGRNGVAVSLTVRIDVDGSCHAPKAAGDVCARCQGVGMSVDVIFWWQEGKKTIEGFIYF